jgi:histidinol phosphatase-like PHP family hydrolase
MIKDCDIQPTRTDYHVHCHHDICAAKDMTLAAIYAEAVKAGLQEICVVKHYSHTLPNNGDVWVNWKRTTPEAFDAFLKEFDSTPQPAGLRVLSGVETELLNQDGDINIPDSQAAKLDMVLVSNHWMPDATGLERVWRPLMGEGIFPCSMNLGDLGPWMSEIKKNGPEPYAKAVFEGNANAVKRHPKARVLAHLGDGGIHILRTFRVPVDDISDDRLLQLSAPLIQSCIDHQALWELNPGVPQRTQIVHEANRKGVRFTATVDAHFLGKPNWGHSLSQHQVAEDNVKALGLTRSRLMPYR